MKTKKEFKQFEPQITQFLELFRQGKEVWLKAGEILVAMIDANPDIIEHLLSLDENLKSDTLEALERIGRKRLLPELLLDDSMGAKRLARLPYQVQLDVYRNGLDVVTKRAGVFVVDHKPINKLTFQQAFTAIGPDGLISVAKQQEKMLHWESATKQRNMRYVVKNEGGTIETIKIEFFKGTEMTLKEIQDLVTRLIASVEAPAAVAESAKQLQPAMQKNQVRPRMAA